MATETVTCSRRQERLLTWTMRVSGGIEIAAALAVFLPGEWMGIAHQFLQFGDMPSQPLFGYLARSTSALWAAHGVVVVFLSLDVQRFLPAIRLIGFLTICLGVTFLGIDLVEKMQIWWTAAEGPVLVLIGTWFLMAAKRLDPEACADSRAC